MLKHIGRLKRNGRKVVVAYRTLPDDPFSCLIVPTESLESADHDTLMTLVDSNVGQNADEFAEAMNRTLLVDGRNMLHRFHTTGKLNKVPTEHVEMTPDNKTVVPLNELNEIIAKQKGISIDDLAVKDPRAKKTKTTEKVADPTPTSSQSKDEPLSDEDLAKSYRSQADQLFKEAKRLREQAEELSPTKKTKKTNEVEQ